MTSSVTPDDKLCGPRQPEVTDLADPRSWRRALRWARPSRYANRNPGSRPALAVKFHNGGLPVNKRAGDSARKGAVRKRSQLKTKVEGEAHWTKRSKASGRFLDQKKSASAKPFKGVRKEGQIIPGVQTAVTIFRSCAGWRQGWEGEESKTGHRHRSLQGPQEGQESPQEKIAEAIDNQYPIPRFRPRPDLRHV